MQYLIILFMLRRVIMNMILSPNYLINSAERDGVENYFHFVYIYSNIVVNILFI